ncbi:response regulator [Cystobacter fuscus DSM 2262]|uniref:Response regulator n=1 Tax=Cystobacter fuscus (strain ATCC 25194 / DSM 2262 / NBRC 100088 / M29) TaxID=1242864 RepID=S9PDA2_CYSF2|nr:response regulator [Cystobacter fuscus]EPX61041.1 response regulator [Cystobacter fuscus DSM 2262]
MKTILVVEDEFDVQQVVADVLKDEGYEVSVCGSGAEALRRLSESRPDVVLLDVMLPVLSGLQVLEVMRKTPGLDRVPVILMSEAIPRIAQSWQLFLKKPFRLEQLLDAVNRVSSPDGRG